MADYLRFHQCWSLEYSRTLDFFFVKLLKKKSVKNWAGEALKMPTVNYLQRETQTRPVFKTYRMVSEPPTDQNISFDLGHEKWDKSG